MKEYFIIYYIITDITEVFYHRHYRTTLLKLIVLTYERVDISCKCSILFDVPRFEYYYKIAIEIIIKKGNISLI